LNRGRDLENRTLATLSRNPFNKVRFLVFPKWMVFNRVEPYYLFHFAQTKETADWNIGFFGPATPSQPLPAKPIGPGTWKPVLVPEFRLGKGTFRVDMIDTWNMKVHFLGYTAGPVQKSHPEIAPGLMRFIKVERAEPGKPVGSVAELVNEFGSHAPE
jgi:hypothetical protein